MSSRFAWFTSPNGRKTMGFVAIGAGIGAFALQYIPHTLLLDKYQKLVAVRKNDQPYRLNEGLEKLFTEVLDDMKLNRFRRDLVKPFIVFGYDVWHAGSFNSQSGGLIGMPINFTYNKPEAVDKAAIVINDSHVNWNKKEAKDFLQSLVLSDHAKKYAIAREIEMLNNYSFIIYPTISAFLVTLFYGLSSSFNDKYSLFEKPRSIRLALHGLVGIFIWGLWSMQKDSLTRYYEYGTDEEVSKLGIEYVKGGLEYYQKIIQRNIALRALSGKRGEGKYTLGGNEQIGLREKHIPNTARKQYFEEKLEAFGDADTKHELSLEADKIIA